MLRRRWALLSIVALPGIVHCVGDDPGAGTSDASDASPGTDATTTTDDAGGGGNGGDDAATSADTGATCPDTPCSNQACVNGFCVGVCTPNEVKCSGNGVQTCEPTGQWSAPVECTNSTCTNGKCTGSCSAGQTECSGNALMGCDGGTWDEPVACVSKTCCGANLAKSCQGSCSPGQTKCSGNALQTCGACGVYGTAVECPTNQTCLGDPAQCGGQCGPTEVRCNGNIPQTCSAGNWTGSTPCVDKTCVNAVCQGVCAVGQRKCVASNQYQVCNSEGAWGSSIFCSTATPACSGAGNCVKLN